MKYLFILLAASACATSKPDTHSVTKDAKVDIICSGIIGLLLNPADVTSYTFDKDRLIIILDDGTVINENASSCTIITKAGQGEIN